MTPFATLELLEAVREARRLDRLVLQEARRFGYRPSQVYLLLQFAQVDGGVERIGRLASAVALDVDLAARELDALVPRGLVERAGRGHFRLLDDGREEAGLLADVLLARSQSLV